MTLALVRDPRIDSPLVGRFVESWDYRKQLVADRESFAAIVLHTTGMGLWNRWRKQGDRFSEPTAFDTFLRVEQTMRFGYTYAVGPERGQLAQCVPEDLASRHVGGSRFRRYAKPSGWGSWRRDRPAAACWLERWHPLTSPIELPAWGEDGPRQSVSSHTVGIGFLPNEENELTAWQIEIGDALIGDIKQRREIPTARNRIVSHFDVDPIGRSKYGIPWDFSRDHWGWEGYAKRVGIR